LNASAVSQSHFVEVHTDQLKHTDQEDMAKIIQHQQTLSVFKTEHRDENTNRHFRNVS